MIFIIAELQVFKMKKYKFLVMRVMYYFAAQGFMGGGLKMVVLSFIFNFGYLLVGYWYTESTDYDICWTMPGCILCLRLIGKIYSPYLAW